MGLARVIEDKIKNNLTVEYFELVNESYKHAVPEGAESHFKLILVSNDFLNLNRVQRQKKIYSMFENEMKNGLHALSMRLLTVDEWKARGANFATPNCLGGGKT